MCFLDPLFGTWFLKCLWTNASQAAHSSPAPQPSAAWDDPRRKPGYRRRAFFLVAPADVATLSYSSPRMAGRVTEAPAPQTPPRSPAILEQAGLFPNWRTRAPAQTRRGISPKEAWKARMGVVPWLSECHTKKGEPDDFSCSDLRHEPRGCHRHLPSASSASSSLCRSTGYCCRALLSGTRRNRCTPSSSLR